MDTLRQPAALRLSLIAATTIAFIVTGSPQRRTVHAQTNPIVDENTLGGTPQAEWDVSGSGDPAIQGFATDISVNTGSVVTFKIKLGVGVPGYSIDVYRLGYYQGFGARKVATVEPTAEQISTSQNQPACLRDDTAGLVDCGNWGVSGTFDTTGMTSGIFIARPKRSDTGGASHIVFIVRDDARKADVLFQTSDTTWQAYNMYPGIADGGSSLYCNGPLSNGGSDYTCATRSAKVSYNRPFDTRDHDKGSWLFNAEFPMIRWMEANGYDVKYWSGVDTDRLGADPAIGLRSALAPRTFFSVGHDEYWSGGQRANVERARDGGVNLAFFSGNEMFWKTRYEASIDGAGTSYRTLVSYKETFATGTDRIDPNGANPWTGTWRDPRFSPPLDGGRPENGLTGQLWTVNCCSTRLVVPAEFKALRFWRNTAVASLPPGEVYVSSPEILGYEWDEDVDNGSRPSGLMRLSSTTIEEPQVLQNFGTRVGPGTPTHALTLYRHNSGALVFGAGTVQWSWGLDAVHDQLPTSPDRAMQQATVNLLADMGVQPLTLQRGADDQPLLPASTSGDVLAPTSSVTFPAAGASVPSGARVTIGGQVTELGGGSVAGVEVSVDGATWHPALMPTPTTFAYDWRPGGLGQATIRTRAIDDSGNLEAAGPGVTVTVGPAACPCTSLWTASAAPIVPSTTDAKPVELGLKFYSDSDGFITGVRFYKGSGNNGTHVGNLWTVAGAPLATAVFTDETTSGWQQVSFASPVAITANTTYVVSYHTDAGRYAADSGYLATTGVDAAPLHAATSAVAHGNGLFAYGGTQFPTESFNATNYWVDVVYSPSVTDVTPPVVSRIKSTIVDSARVTLTWTTDEMATSRIEYSTDPTLLTSTTILPPGTITINQPAFVLQHSVALTGLSSNTTYYYRIVSVDRSGNAADVAAPTFTVPGPTLRDTSSPDFSAGTASGTYVSETVNGEVTLAPAVGTEFSGSTLDPGWSAVRWDTGGFASIGNGVLVVDGTRVGTCDPPGAACDEVPTLSPGHRLEFVATFSVDGFQHAGFGRLLTDGPWAIFSTDRGGTIMARSMTAPGGAVANDEIPNGATYLGKPHRYGIDWRSDRVDYYIDGALVKTHALAVQGPMRPIAASDFSPFGGNIVVDWVRLLPYAAAGTFESRVFDASQPADWRTIQWTATTPAGTSAAIDVRVGDTPTPDGAWTAWQPIAAPGPLALRSRYIQYRASLATSDANVSPSLDDIIITTGHAPVAVDDSIVVPQNGVSTLPATGAGSLVANDIDSDGDQLEVVAVGPASHGTVALQFDGSVRYVPQTNYNGPDAFTYTVSDGLMTSSATVSVLVRFGNVPPVAKNDFYTLNEDARLDVPAAAGVLANDTDAEHDLLSAVLTSLPSNGQLAINSLGGFTYTPNPNYAGPDFFTYQAYDGQALSEPARVDLNVLQVNDPPVTVADAYTAIMNHTLTVPARGVLANDRDVEVEDTAPLHAQLVGPAANGAVTLNADGSFTYTPAADFLGVDTFTYAAVDHFGAVGNTETVSITVVLTAVDEAVNGGGTVSTGDGVTPGDPLASAVTLPSAGTVRIAQGVIAGSQPPTGYTFMNRQVNITILNPDGTEMLASPANPLRLAFTIDASLLLPGENETSVQVFRNGVNIPECPGLTAIGADNRDPCVTQREGGAAVNGGVRLTILSTHASTWNMGLSSDAIGDAPRAQNDGVYQVDFQTPLTVGAAGVLGNDYGRNGLRAVLSEGSAIGGSVALGASGGFVFTPGAGTCGPASFKYRASDGTAIGNEATVSIVVDCKPQAVDDSVSALEDSGKTTITVLSNDTDPDAGQKLTVTQVSAPAHGVAAIALAGAAIDYTPAADFFGRDSFEYAISDGRGGVATATVAVDVLAVNDAPRFTKGADQSVREDAGPQSVAGWATAIAAGPVNESTQAVTFAVTGNTNPSLFAAAPAVDAAGTLTYTPLANASGTASITLVATDDGGTLNGGVNRSAPVTFSITVVNVNDAPGFVKGADVTVLEDAPAQSIAGWATAISAGPADEAGQAVNFIVTTSNDGLFAARPAISPAGTLTFTPAPDANGTATVTVQLHDDGGVADGGSDTSVAQTFTVTVTPVNDVPSFASGVDQAVKEDAGPQSVLNWATKISAGPADESAQALTFVVTNSNRALFLTTGQPAIDGKGTLTFTSAPDANGSAIVTVRLRDSGGTANGGIDTSAPQTFVISVAPVNDNPIANPDSATVLEDSAATSINVLSNDTIGPDTGETLTVTAVTPAAHGAVAFTATGVTYTPAATYNGPDNFSYTIGDGNGGSATANVAVTVTAVNDAPSFIMGADQAVKEDAGPQSVLNWATKISAGPADESTQALTFAVTNNNPALFLATGQPAIDGKGTLTFTSAPDANGSANVTVRLRDSGGTANGGIDTSAPQTFVIAVAPVNDNPIANADSATLPEDNGPTAIDVLANDTIGPDTGETLTVTAVTPAAHGAVAFTATGVTYTPAPNYNGPDSFTYTIGDGNGGSATATVRVTVTPVNDNPIANADSATLPEDSGPTAIDVLANDSTGPDSGETLTVTAVTQGAHGTVTLTAAGVAYAPAANYNGPDEFTYTIGDGNGGSATAKVSVTVTPVNDNPIASPDSATVLEDSAATSINVLSNDTIGPDTGETLAVTAVTPAAHGAVAFTATGVTYTPAANYNGPDGFTYTIGDGNGGSATARVSVTVTAVNDAPSFIKGADQTSVPGAGPQTVAGWATGISAGPADEATQILTFDVATDNPGLFAAQPAIAPNGTLTYTPAASGGGVANVRVRLQDDGGIANGGVNASAAQAFTIALPYPTTTTLASPTVSPTTFGQAVVLNASVTSTGGPVTGAVDFTDNGVLLGSVPLTNGAASLTTSAIGAGTARTVKAIYRAASGFLSSEATLTLSVTAAATTTTLTAASAQYSDVTTFQTTVTGSSAAAPAQSATFSVGTEVIGTANLTWDAVAGLYRASYTGPLVESTYTATGGQLKPGSKNIKVVYNGVSPNYTLAARSGSFAINREDATVAYVGATTVLCGTSCSAVVVPLKAKVGEIDASPGDLRNANVTFVNRTTGLAIATVAVDATGTASFNWTVNLGTAASQTTKIGMVVGNYYVRSNALDDGTVVIKR